MAVAGLAFVGLAGFLGYRSLSERAPALAVLGVVSFVLATVAAVVARRLLRAARKDR
jgi:hypothetical protein